MMKVIFLDFDGVITHAESKWKFDSVKADMINGICRGCDAKIVITSSWRIGFQGNIEIFKLSLLNDFRVKTNPSISYDILKSFIGNIYDMTDTQGSMRGDEIRRWLEKHYMDVENYVILDDDSDMLDEQLLHFVQTDTYEGITDREMKLCVGVLNNEETYSMIRLNDVLKYRWRLKCEHPEIDNNIITLLERYKQQFLIQR